MSEAARVKLEVQALRVRYRDALALRDVTLAMHERRVTALIGPSGCGKSTFLRALNRMHDLVPEAVVSGRILLDGHDVLGSSTDPVELRRRVGMVFQKSTPFPKSIEDNVAYGLRVAGERRRAVVRERVEEALRGAGLWDEVAGRLGQSALGLSGGQQQRLCIARAIATRPEVLLLDEPASALDPIAAGHVEELILELRRQYTIIIVTHSLAQARRVSDTTAFFYMGELLEAGPTAQVLEDPQHERTSAYVRGRIG